MADERDDDRSGEKEDGQQTAGQQSHRSEYGAQGQQTMANQGAEGSFGGESSGSQSGSADASGSSIAGCADDGTSGQPIGGNDSNTGSGTVLTQGADFGDRSDSADSSGEGFIGSQGTGLDKYLRDNNQSADSDTRSAGSDATDGTDFADQGQGATDEQ